jgi:hypothetical protein
MPTARSEAPEGAPHETLEWTPPLRIEPEEGRGTADAAERGVDEVGEEAELAGTGPDLAGMLELVHGCAVAVASDGFGDGEEEDTRGHDEVDGAVCGGGKVTGSVERKGDELLGCWRMWRRLLELLGHWRMRWRLLELLRRWRGRRQLLELLDLALVLRWGSLLGFLLLVGSSGNGGDEWRGHGVGGRDRVIGGEAAIDADLPGGREPGEDVIDREVALLRGVGRLFEQPSPVVQNYHGIDGGRLLLVDALRHDADRLLELSTPVVGLDLWCCAELLEAVDAELLGGNSLLPRGRRGAPLPPSLELVQLQDVS